MSDTPMDIRALEALRTPCFVMDQAEFTAGVRAFHSAFSARFPNFILGYSVKTNRLPAALGLARNLGCHAEVASHDEYLLARACGFKPVHIIYNGPMKRPDTMLEAVAGGGVVNIECHREIEWLKMLPPSQKYPVGVRVAVDMGRVSPKDAKHEDLLSRFGFCAENGELRLAASRIAAMGKARVDGLHFHRTSKTRSPSYYRSLAAFAARAARSLGISPRWIDLGGGFFGIYPGAPSATDYADAIYEGLSLGGLDIERTTLILEPGSALAAAAFSFVTQVIDIKPQPGGNIVVTDGSRTCIDPFFHKESYFHTEIRRDLEAPIVPVQHITGATCLENDRLFTLRGGTALSVGDYVVYDKVGAYTLSLTSDFINLTPPVYLRRPDHAGSLSLVREKGSIDRWMEGCRWEP